MSETEAAVLFATNSPLRLTIVRMPAPRAGQVRVAMAYSGLCHSQLLEVRGRRGVDRFLPHTLGHEGSGIVREVGPDVTKVKPGDRVVLSWIKGSGADVPSTIYDSAEGPINSGAISTFMRETITCESRVTPIPEAMPLREAALLGCAVPTGAGIVLNTARITAGSSVAIFGAGGIGLSAVLAAAMIGAAPIIAVDVWERKLQMALELGATHTVNAREQDPLRAIRDITAGTGVDYAIEAAGQREAMEAAYESVRVKGGVCVLAGNLTAGTTISLDPVGLIRGKRLLGTWGGESDPDRDIPRFVELHLTGKLKLTGLVTHQFPIERLNEAFAALENGELGRALINLDGDRLDGPKAVKQG